MTWVVQFLDREVEAAMSRKFIPVEEALREWRKDPEYVAAYESLENEFALASALIKARADAAMTQEQVALAMGTTQAAVARMESGKTMPSTRTLARFAKATRTRLRISFEPVKPGPIGGDVNRGRRLRGRPGAFLSAG
jgi:DNA-binding XRE family transcriptional regulator